MSVKATSMGANVSERVSEFGKALRRLLDPNQDKLLAGYSELIQCDKNTLVSNVEDQKIAAQSYYESTIDRASKDKRTVINSDDLVRNFLIAKKFEMYDIIKQNMKKLKKFPKHHSLVSKISAKQKVEQLEQSLRNPQLKILADLVLENRNRTTSEAQSLSPLSRRQAMMSDKQQHSLRSRVAPLTSARGIRLDDLGTLLEDLEALELQQTLSALQSKPQDSQTSQDIEKAKQQLQVLQQRPSLSELIYRSVEKNDHEAIRLAEEKIEQLRQRRDVDLDGRLRSMVGVFQETPQQAQLNNRIHNIVSQSNFEDSPDHRRSGDCVSFDETHSTRPPSKNILPIKSILSPKQSKAACSTSSYRYEGIQQILQSANANYKFMPDIDDSEEDEISDEGLREAIKSRKYRERSRRDELALVKTAALDAMKSVEQVRTQLRTASYLEKAINMDELRLRQASLREAIDNSDALPHQIQVGNHKMGQVYQGMQYNTPYNKTRTLEINIHSPSEQSAQPPSASAIAQTQHLSQGGQSYTFSRHLNQGYEPCAEQQYEESNSSQSEFNPNKLMLNVPSADNKKLMLSLEDQMKKIISAEKVKQVDSLDKDFLNKYNFKASFISHISSIVDKKAQYKSRLQTYDDKKSTKTNLINQAFLDQKIHESIQRRRSTTSALSMEDSAVSTSQLELHNQLSHSVTALGETQYAQFQQNVLTLANSSPSSTRQTRQYANPAQSRDLNQVPPRSQVHTTPGDVDERIANHGEDLYLVDSSHQTLQQQRRENEYSPYQAVCPQNSPQLPSRNHAAGNEIIRVQEQIEEAKETSQREVELNGAAHNHFSSLSLKIILNPRQDIQNNIGAQKRGRLLVHPEQPQVFKKQVRKNERMSNTTVLKSDKEIPKADLSMMSYRINQDLSEIPGDLIFAQQQQLTRDRSIDLLKQVASRHLATNNSRSLLGTQSSASHDRLFEHKLNLSSPVAADKKEFNAGNVMKHHQQSFGLGVIQSRSRLGDATTLESQAPVRNIIHMRDDSKSPQKMVVYDQFKTLTTQSSKQQPPVICDLAGQQSLQTSSQERSKDLLTIAQLAGEEDLSKIQAEQPDIDQSAACSPQFIISPSLGSRRDLHLPKRDAHKRTSSQPKISRQHLQQTQFQFPITDDTPETSRLLSNYEQQLAASFRMKIQRRFGAQVSISQPQNIAYSPRELADYAAISEEAGYQWPRQHRSSVTSSEIEVSAEKKRKSSQLSTQMTVAERTIVAKEVSVKSGTGLDSSGAKQAATDSIGQRATEISRDSLPGKNMRSSIGAWGQSMKRPSMLDQLSLECNPDLQNVIKLELQERPSRSYLGGAPRVAYKCLNGPKIDGERDSASEEKELIKQPSLFGDQITITKYVQPQKADAHGPPFGTTFGDIQLQTDYATQIGATQIISSRIATSNKFSAGEETQNFPESINLNDVSSPTPVQMLPQSLELAFSAKKEQSKNMKGSKVPNNFYKRDIVCMSNDTMPPAYRSIENRNISFMQQLEQRSQRNGSEEQKSGKSNDASPIQTTREVSPVHSRNKLTPHLGGTNVKIALHKEKTKRIQKLLRQTSSKQSLERNEEPVSTKKLPKKGSSPFLLPRQPDQSSNNEPKFFMPTKQVQKTLAISRTSDEKLNHSISKSSENEPTSGKTRGQESKAIKSKSSNPLLILYNELEKTPSEKYLPIQSIEKIKLHQHSQENEQSGSDQQPEAVEQVLTAKGWTPNSRERTRTMGKMTQDIAERLDKRSSDSQADDEVVMSEGAHIEHDKKTTKNLLPPLLDSTSAKKFFNEDEINLNGEDARQKIKCAPMRDSSTDIYEKTKREVLRKEKGIEVTKFKLKSPLNIGVNQSVNWDNPLSPQHQTQYSVGPKTKFSPASLSVLHEHQKGDLAQSLLRQSVRDSNLSSIIREKDFFKKYGSQGNYQTIYHGSQTNQNAFSPIHQTRTQRIKLPTLNRSMCSSQHVTASQSQSDALSPPLQNKYQQRSPPDPIQGEQEFVEQRIANNFHVKIKKQLQQSFEDQNRMRTLGLDGTRGVCDSLKLDNSADKKHQIVNARGRNGRIYMHQTLTQVLVTPEDLKLHHKRIRPPKPLVLRAGSQTCRAKHKLQEPAEKPERNTSLAQYTKPLRVREMALGSRLGSNGILSGSMQLTPANKVKLTSQIGRLAPLSLPPVLAQLMADATTNQDLAPFSPQQSHARLIHQESNFNPNNKDAHTEARLSSINSEKLHDSIISNHPSGSLLSRSSMKKV